MTTNLFKDILSVSSGTMAVLAKDLGLVRRRFRDLDAIQSHWFNWTSLALGTIRGQNIKTWQDAWKAYVADMQKI